MGFGSCLPAVVFPPAARPAPALTQTCYPLHPHAPPFPGDLFKCLLAMGTVHLQRRLADYVLERAAAAEAGVTHAPSSQAMTAAKERMAVAFTAASQELRLRLATPMAVPATAGLDRFLAAIKAAAEAAAAAHPSAAAAAVPALPPPPAPVAQQVPLPPQPAAPQPTQGLPAAQPSAQPVQGVPGGHRTLQSLLAAAVRPQQQPAAMPSPALAAAAAAAPPPPPPLAHATTEQSVLLAAALASSGTSNATESGELEPPAEPRLTALAPKTNLQVVRRPCTLPGGAASALAGHAAQLPTLFSLVAPCPQFPEVLNLFSQLGMGTAGAGQPAVGVLRRNVEAGSEEPECTCPYLSAPSLFLQPAGGRPPRPPTVGNCRVREADAEAACKRSRHDVVMEEASDRGRGRRRGCQPATRARWGGLDRCSAAPTPSAHP